MVDRCIQCQGHETMICPRCGHDMDETSSAGIPVHGCAGCAGSWISGPSLNRFFAKYDGADDIQEAFDGILDLEFNASRRRCPACASRFLKTVMIDDTELDYCVSCKGLFFDKGELEAVFPNFEAKQPGKAPRKRDASEGLLQSIIRWLRGDG